MAKTSAKRKVKASRRAKTAARRTSARRPVKAAAQRAFKARKPAKQAFVASHHDEAGFKGGLRRYAKYRDLGIGAATKGLAQAHVIRMVPPCIPEEVSKLHYHDVDFQMIYVLKGWIKTEIDGQGAHLLHAGAAWTQPPRVKHKVLDYSDDCELLEIVMPAEFDTVELEA